MWARLLPAAVGVLLLVPSLFLYLSSGLLAPLWAVAGYLAMWAVLVVLAVRWFRSRPWLVLGLPVAGLVVWWATLTLGEQVLGWTP